MPLHFCGPVSQVSSQVARTRAANLPEAPRTILATPAASIVGSCKPHHMRYSGGMSKIKMMDRNESLDTIAANVDRLRIEREWSVREMARRSHNTAMIVSRIIRRENMPAGDVLARIASACGVTIDTLFASSNRKKFPHDRLTSQ